MRATIFDVRLTVHFSATSEWLAEKGWVEGSILAEPRGDDVEGHTVAGMIGSIGPADHRGVREVGLRVLARHEGRAIESFTGWVASLVAPSIQKEEFVTTMRKTEPRHAPLNDAQEI